MRPGPAHGFTLVELLVAVSLAAGIVLLAAALMRGTISVGARTEARLGQHQSLRDVQRLIEGAWAKREARGIAATYAGILFVSREKTLSAAPVEFACLVRDDGLFGLVFYRQPRPAGGVAGANVPGEVLLDGLTQCAFGFMRAPTGDKDAATWVSEWPAEREAPSVLRLDLATASAAFPPFIVAVDSP